MSFENLDLQREAMSQGAATGDAKLAGLPGTGTLQVWRGQREDVLRIVGTWRLEEDANGLDELREALSKNKPVSYEGVHDDPARPDRRRVATDVYVTSIGSYQRRKEDDVGFCFVNFVPIDQKEVTD